jgi:two-component system, LytTR family, response regulator
MNFSCVAVDDEPLALEKTRYFIEKLPQLKLVATFRNGSDALNFIRNNNVQLIFLDIQMDKMTGIEMLEQMANRPQVILTTAYSEYALRGFELSVTDYLLKPFTFERFAQAVNKATEYLQWQHNALISEKGTVDYIFVKSGYKLVKIMQDEILYIEGMRDFQCIMCKTEKILASHSMLELEKILNKGFVRCHKSYIVSIPKINSIERERIFIGNKSIPIGEMYREEFYKHI